MALTKFGLQLGDDVLLVRSTVAKGTGWSATEVVDVERATVPDLDTCGPVTTAAAPVKTACVLHRYVGTQEVGILVPAEPWKRYHPGPIPLSHFILL